MERQERDHDPDTDDTDALLNSDPMGGLFRGLSLKELTERHENLLEKESSGQEKGTKTEAANDESQGELQLSEWTDSDLDEEEEEEVESENQVVKVDSESTKQRKKSEEEGQQGQGPNLALKSFIPQFLNQGKVVDINLENPATGWNIPLPSFLQEKGGTSFINERGEQVFFRAPNFRTPGGYQPLTKSSSRNMSENEILEETRKMYHEEPEQDSMEDNSDRIPAQARKVLRFEDEVELDFLQREQERLNFNFLNGTAEPVKFEAEAKPKSAEEGRRKHIASKGKRKGGTKLQMQGAGDYMTPVASESSFASGNVFVKEGEVNGNNNGTDDDGISRPQPAPSFSTQVIRGMKRSKPKHKPPTQQQDVVNGNNNGFSFGYGEQALSPIQKVQDWNLDKNKGPGPLYKPSACIEELNAIYREIQVSRAQLSNKAGQSSFIEDLGAVKSKPRKDGGGDDMSTASSSAPPIKYLMDSRSRSTNPSRNPPPAFDQFDSDLETLLQEADINAEDFEEIVEELDIEGCDVGAGIDDLLNEIVHPETTPEGKEQAKLSHWAQSGAVEYVEKYHEEKFRRQECEDEITRLNKVILEVRQRNAVLEGVTKRKDGTIYRIHKAWKTLADEWKEFEEMTSRELEKVKKEQEELIKVSSESKERISQYEKELLKSVEMSEEFKSKLVELQGERDAAVAKLNNETEVLQGTVQELNRTIVEIMEEKKAAIRALKESQQQLDHTQSSLSRLDSDFELLKESNSAAAMTMADLRRQKENADILLKEEITRNLELQERVKELTERLDSSLKDKESLRREYEVSTNQKLKEEGNRLHDYYTKKLQDALKSTIEKAEQAESSLLESMKKTSLESERKLAECKERYAADLNRMKTIYELEMKELKKDNVQKQMLIQTTAHQLQRGGLTRTDSKSLLPSPSPNVSPSHFPEKEDATKDDFINSNINKEYAKFVQNLANVNIVGNSPTKQGSTTRPQPPKFPFPGLIGDLQILNFPGKPAPS